MTHRHIGVAVLALGLAATHAAGQDSRWMPDTRWFASPVADPREPRFGGALISSNVFVDESSPIERPPYTVPEFDGREIQGTAYVGGTFPLWRNAGWRDGAMGGVVVGVQVGAFGRFRVERKQRDLVADDWVVGLPIEVRRGVWSVRLRPHHSSGHLGDEMMRNAGMQRSPFSYEAVDLLLAWGGPSTVRVYGGGGYVIHSDAETDPRLQLFGFRDRGRVQAGVDLTRFPWRGGRVGYQAGLDWQRAERADWTDQLSVLGGVAVRGARYTACLRLWLYDGPSPLGQFFATEERFWGLELAFEL